MVVPRLTVVPIYIYTFFFFGGGGGGYQACDSVICFIFFVSVFR